MRAGYEGGIVCRRDDGSPDTTVEIRGRNREVNLTLSIDGAKFSWGRMGVDLKPDEAWELIGALKDALQAAGPEEAVRPRSVADNPPVWQADNKWTARQVGHVLGERD